MSIGNVHISAKRHKPIYDVTPFTLMDYPGHTACIVWFSGCNMRCPYCYNPDIVKRKGRLSVSEVLTFLEKRQGLLQGVVLSGGECLLHPAAFEVASRAKKMGFLVKADTNGSCPEMLKKLLDCSLLDGVSLDFKALPERETAVTGKSFFSHFCRSLELLVSAATDFEVRTTIHSSLLSENDLLKMGAFLWHSGYRGTYYLQRFMSGVDTLGSLPPDGNTISEACLSRFPLTTKLRN
ncbi:anaerobic ribonucleoside-triphosphate reductase activating protein [Sinomicrobium oceani]|nr:anaerobic ribonucleoside-triphosphate reductase activating protein [Sinomicrobium oceani]